MLGTMATRQLSGINDPQVPSPAEIFALLEAGKLQFALTEADRGLSLCTATQRPMLLVTQANALAMLGQPLAALRIATTAHELALADGSLPLIAETELALAFALQSLEEHGRAIDVTAECERIAHQTQDIELLARAQRTLGISYSVLGRHEQALELLAGVIPMLEQHARSPERLFHAHFSLINARSRAVTMCSESKEQKQAHCQMLHRDWQGFVERAGAMKLVRLQAMALGNSGIAARFAGDLDAALPELQRAFALQMELGLKAHAAVSKNHIGAALQTLGHPHEAIAAFKHGIELLQGGNPRDLASAWEELAATYEAVDDPRSALAALKQAREIERKLHDDAAHVAAARLEQKAEIAKLAEQWTRLATEDALTGLANRRAFDRHLRAVSEAVQRGRHFSLAAFDLDHFKAINDRHGHAIGDAVLRRFAEILREGRRRDDLPARIGGEEFSLVLTTETLAQALAVVEKIRDRVNSEPRHVIAPGLELTVSAGVVCSSEPGVATSAPEHITAIADQRLYRAKHGGRNRVLGE